MRTTHCLRIYKFAIVQMQFTIPNFPDSTNYGDLGVRSCNNTFHLARREAMQNARPARMPRKQCNWPVKVRRGELSVHPASEDPGLRGDSQA